LITKCSPRKETKNSPDKAMIIFLPIEEGTELLIVKKFSDKCTTDKVFSQRNYLIYYNKLLKNSYYSSVYCWHLIFVQRISK